MKKEVEKLNKALEATKVREYMKDVYPFVSAESIDLLLFHNTLTKDIIYERAEVLCESFLNTYKYMSDDTDSIHPDDFKIIMMDNFIRNVLEIQGAADVLCLLYMNKDISLEQIKELIPDVIEYTRENLWSK